MRSHPLGELCSALGPTIARYVAVKQALGRQFDGPSRYLAKLDHFLHAQRAADLDTDTFAEWTSTLGHLKASGRRQRMRIVYHFCLFRRRSVACFVPDPSQFPQQQPRPVPYIFSEEDARLLLITESLKAHSALPLHPQVARLGLVLLYTTGLRRGELIRLTVGDYDTTEAVLHVRQSKFHKSRLLPLSGDATREVEGFLLKRRQLGLPLRADSPLLFNGWGGEPGYTGAGFADLMRKLFRRGGIRNAAGRTPRVHDLRFSFAVHALLRWYRAGIDVQTRLPALSTYMGHASISATQYYLRFLEPVARLACDRFESHCARFLPPISLLPGGDQ
ncbi:MAG: tyrosine-type recombinase/integrase [Armatimonadota bacterium]